MESQTFTDLSVIELYALVKSSPTTDSNSSVIETTAHYPLKVDNHPELSLTGKFVLAKYNHISQIASVRYTVEPPLNGSSMFAKIRELYQKYYSGSANIGHFIYRTPNLAHMTAIDVVIEVVKANASFRKKYLDTLVMIRTKIELKREDRVNEIMQLRSGADPLDTMYELTLSAAESSLKMYDYDIKTLEYLHDIMTHNFVTIDCSSKIMVFTRRGVQTC